MNILNLKILVLIAMISTEGEMYMTKARCNIFIAVTVCFIDFHASKFFILIVFNFTFIGMLLEILNVF